MIELIEYYLFLERIDLFSIIDRSQKYKEWSSFIIFLEGKEQYRMLMINSMVTMKEILATKTCSVFYKSHSSDLQEFVKSMRQLKIVEEEHLELFVDFLVDVLDECQSNTEMHEIIVLMNSILNIKNQLVVRIVSKRKTTHKLVSYFKQCVYRFQISCEINVDNPMKRNFEIYSIIHLVTILLNYQSKNKNKGNQSLFQNSSLINTIFSLDLTILTKKESSHLMSIVVILLLKNIDLEKYSTQTKQYILENITHSKDQRSTKNLIQSLKRIIVSIKVEERQITKNNIIQWIMDHIKLSSHNDNIELISLVKLLLFKFPALGKKFISLGILEVLTVIFIHNSFLVCSVYDILIPHLDNFQKQILHNFLLQNLSLNSKNIFPILSKLTGSCELLNLTKSIQSGLLNKISKAMQIQYSVHIQSILQYLHSLITRVKQLNQLLAQSLVEMIFIGDTLRPLECSLVLEIKLLYSTFKEKYFITV